MTRDENYWSKYDISVSLVGVENDFETYAKVETFGYPDGSVKNSLSPDELREVAEMLETAADKMERNNNE